MRDAVLLADAVTHDAGFLAASRRVDYSLLVGLASPAAVGEATSGRAARASHEYATLAGGHAAFGIVNCLTTYSTRKTVANMLHFPRASPPPVAYGQRFEEFVRLRVLKLSGAARSTGALARQASSYVAPNADEGLASLLPLEEKRAAKRAAHGWLQAVSLSGSCLSGSEEVERQPRWSLACADTSENLWSTARACDGTATAMDEVSVEAQPLWPPRPTLNATGTVQSSTGTQHGYLDVGTTEYHRGGYTRAYHQIPPDTTKYYQTPPQTMRRMGMVCDQSCMLIRHAAPLRPTTLHWPASLAYGL